MASDETRLNLDNLFASASDTTTTDGAASKEVWVKPEIVSYEPISATASITASNPGDILSSNS